MNHKAVNDFVLMSILVVFQHILKMAEILESCPAFVTAERRNPLKIK